METLTLNLPLLYGDHHVTEVRRILLEIPGVESVYASSSFQVVEVAYNPTRTDAATITARLDAAGYLGDLPIPLEPDDVAVSYSGEPAYFRHSATYQQTGRATGFMQNVSDSGRALWPCPGIGVIKERNDGKERA